MKSQILFFVAAILPIIALADETNTKNIQIKNILAQAKESFNTPAIVTAISCDGEVVFADAQGLANIETKTLAQTTDVFRIGSVSKPLAAALLLTLVDEKRLELDKTIGHYFPNYPKDKQAITIRHLLSHTSGMRHYHYDLGEKENHQAFNNLIAGLNIFNVKRSPLLFEPGSDYSYSSYGYNLIGALIERVTQLPYGEALKKRVFEPAHMTSSYLDNYEEIIEGRVGQYRLYNETLANAPYVDSSHKWSAGGLLSNVYDLLKFYSALVKGEIMSKSLVELSHTATILPSGRDTQYGLGWRVFEQDGVYYVSHGGSATGGRAYLLGLKGQDVAVAILVNVEKADGMMELALQILNTWTRTP